MARRKRKGRAVRNNANRSEGNHEPEELTGAPHSFVIHRGEVGKCVQDLTADFRKVMEPFTASKIKVGPNNALKDFVSIAGPLNVSHLVMFTRTTLGPYLRIARFPRGPTLTLKVLDYALARDVRSSLKKQITYDQQFSNHALLILNGFSSEAGREVGLMSSMFQNMFPSINVTNVKINTIRRCVILNRDAETDTIDFRHYTIKVVPVGISKPVKKIIQGKIPNLGRYQDVNEFMAKGGGNLSESEAEDDEAFHVPCPQGVSSRGNVALQQSSIRLVELGPRMKLQLIKIEDGLLDGEVLHHRFIEKTEKEKKAIKVAREKKKNEKEKRRKEQEANVRKKVREKDEHKEKSLAGMAKSKLRNVDSEDLPPSFRGEMAAGDDNDADDDDDEEWFRKEVGEEPEKDLFDGGDRKRRFSSTGDVEGRFKKRMVRKKMNPKKPGEARQGGKVKFTVKVPSASKGRFGRKSTGEGRKNRPSFTEGFRSRDQKQKKRPLRVFNQDGIGPNFKRKKRS